MEYTIQKVAGMAGITTRTLRYYDQIGLLRPARVSSSGYRIYGGRELERLQQILFYRALGVELEEIGRILDAPGWSALEALRQHRLRLTGQRDRLDQLIQTLDSTIQAEEQGTPLADEARFAGFKQALIEENERLYGREVRDLYGDEVVEASNARLLGMTQQQHRRQEQLAEQIHAALAQAVAQGDPAGEQALRACALHREWLAFHWGEVTPEGHMGLGRLYVEDPRFTAHYDDKTPGAAQFLCEALRHYYSGEEST